MSDNELRTIELAHPPALRDFIYLDVERVKSLLAQLEQGLLTGRAELIESTESSEGRAGVGVPGLADLGGRREYIWTNQSTETRTLHDHIYTATEAKLKELGKLVELSERFDSVSLAADEVRAGISPVAYVLARGRPFLNDYTSLTEFMGEYNDLIRIFTMMAHSKALNAAEIPSKRKEIEKHIDQEAKTKQLSPSYVNGLHKIMRMFYSDRLVIKILPFDDPDVRITGPLRPECLRDSMENIRIKFGSAPDASWCLFGQIAAVPLESSTPPPTGQYFSNELEGAMSQLFEALRGIEKFFGVSYPEIAVTPIAIFRE